MDINSRVVLSSGNSMPIIGLGTWRLTNDTAKTIMKALRLGYPMIDTSGDYGTQPSIGQGLKDSGLMRDEYYIVTKVEETDDAYKAAIKNLEELQIDYVDLMLIHRPPKRGIGEKLWQGLMRAKKEGLTKDIGVSNYSEDQMEELMDATGEAPVVNQIEWSPFGHSLDMLDFCNDNEIIVQAYSPLTHGKRLDDSTLEDVAYKHSKTPAQILLRWNLQLGTVPIVKANQEAHLMEDIDIFDFELDDNDIVVLNDLNEHYSSLGSLPYVGELTHSRR